MLEKSGLNKIFSHTQLIDTIFNTEQHYNRPNKTKHNKQKKELKK